MSALTTSQQLWELESIKQLKYRYMRSVDTKDWHLLMTCLTPDVEAHYGTAEPCYSPKVVAEFISSQLPAEVTSVHTLTQPEITLSSPTEASGAWVLADVIVYPDRGVIYRGAARYRDSYVKIDETWLIQRTEYQRFYEEALSTKSHRSTRFGSAPQAWMLHAGSELHINRSAHD